MLSPVPGQNRMAAITGACAISQPMEKLVAFPPAEYPVRNGLPKAMAW